MLSSDSTQICTSENGFCFLRAARGNNNNVDLGLVSSIDGDEPIPISNPSFLKEKARAKSDAAARYRPAYELEDGTLERAGRAPNVGTAVNVPP